MKGRGKARRKEKERGKEGRKGESRGRKEKGTKGGRRKEKGKERGKEGTLCSCDFPYENPWVQPEMVVGSLQ